MKKLFSLLFISLIFVGLSSCVKTQHSIRITNNFSQAANVIVGAANFGLVSPGKTTSYQNIPEGSSKLGGDLIGTVSVTGKGTVKWTLTITPSGTTDIKQD
ncbi:hypothetical protein [Aurantibacillus circumpalustris]|uniref:hypothetical protein n=1 Tax=Aurantibacillus circumpalustris TaxID=3036359 RepID=UPI00295BC9D5|nr:hypothetical protein [Aurantibacillus circumpalustris]